MSTEKWIDRRTLIGAMPLLFGSSLLPAAWAATGATASRLLIINLRGALDGLAAVMPTGDPAFAALRPAEAADARNGRPLDSTFTLNPNLSTLHQMYGTGEALFFHAVATPYRDRSHFDAQNVLESGQSGVSTINSGWLNRALAVMPIAKGEKQGRGGLAVSPVVPLLLRGTAPVESWQPQLLPSANADLAARLLTVYEARDPVLAAALRRGVGIDQFLAEAPQSMKGRMSGVDRFATTMAAVGRLMGATDGPRIAAMSIDGWDTHAAQGATAGRLARQLGALDGGVAAFKAAMGLAWSRTTAIILTEFGRTARMNGAGGTDHGTGGIAIAVGGNMAGGRVLADWPGVADKALYQNRDLMPTMDLRGILKGVLHETLDLSDAVLNDEIFPRSQGAVRVRGLVRA